MVYSISFKKENVLVFKRQRCSGGEAVLSLLLLLLSEWTETAGGVFRKKRRT